MKYKFPILLVVIAAALGTFLILSPKMFKTTSSQQTLVNKINTPQTDNKGAVMVEVTPVTLVGGREATFQVALETHSVDLDVELVKTAQLADDKGNRYEATSWSGGAGGHHLSGTLTFPKISAQARSVTLVVLKIDNQDRKFSWNL